MTDSVGNLTLPAGTADTPPGDPILSPLLQFFAQCLRNNVGPLWASIEPNVLAIKTTDTRCPTDDAFTSTELPALFLWRAGFGEFRWLAHDYRLQASTLTLQWVLPQLQVQWRRQRRNAFNAAAAALQMPLEQWGRAPGLIFPGDTDPAAQTAGSLIFSFAKFFSLSIGKAEIGKIRVGVDAGAKFYDAITWQLAMVERAVPDMAADYLPLAGVSGTVSNYDLPLTTFQMPPPAFTSVLGTPLAMPANIEPGIAP